FCFETKILREMIFMHLLHLQQSFASYRIDDDDNARHYADYENSLHELCSTTLVDSLKGCASPEALAPAFFDLFRYAEPFLKHSLSRDSDPTLAWLCLHSPYKTCTHGVYFCLPLHRLYGMMVRTLVTKFPEAPAAAYLAENMKRNAFHHFAEHPLGLFVTRGQVLANMWRRDNMGIAQLSEWWARVPRLASSIRHDFVVVQLEAALGPSSAACHIAHRFSAHQPLLQDTQEREHNIIEFFFRFVLSLATDFSCYSSDVKETLKDSLRHSLALGPKKFSELSELQDRDELEAAEQCLLDVAEVVRREENAQFRLKDGMWPTINPYSALWEERKLVKADAEYAKLKARHSLLPCKVPENPPPCMAPAVGLLCAEVVLATAVAAIRDAATMPWVTENVVRKALDVLHLALRTSELYATVYGAVQKPENAFLASRRDMAAALVPQDVISWEIAEDRQPDVAAMLTKPNAAGRVPVSYAVDLLKVSRLKELHAPVHDVLDLLRKASPEAREAVELAAKVLVQAKEKDGAATAKENKMAKALARQKAALAKMQKKQTELVLDDFSDEGEADAGDAGDDGASRPSCHDLLDVAWLQDKECTFCGMTVSPNGQTDVALIAQVARGNALQKCFQKERADCPAKKGKVSADEDEDEVLEHSLCSVRTLFDGGACHVHTCGHIAHLDCCSSHMKHIRQASRLTQAHLDSFSVYKGQGIISLALNEFMCPLCSRIANSLCPLVNPTNAKKSKARTVPFVKLMSELPSDDDVNRSESDLVEVFDSFVEDSEACGVAKMEEDTFYQVAVETFAGRVSDAVFRRWRPHTSRATDRKGGAKLGWAHQCAAIEISTRTSDVRQVSLTKLTNLRAQLKATVAAEEVYPPLRTPFFPPTTRGGPPLAKTREGSFRSSLARGMTPNTF
ncbi:E3 ubiquitin-protein ligase ubr1, partial [Diplonema papillatum]